MDKLFGLSVFFYEAQRSGKLPADNRVSWRGDSPIDLDGDQEGGWYDAGDHVKFHLPLFYSAGRLALAAWRYAPALEASGFDGQTNMYWLRRELRWIMGYIMRCHPDIRTLVAQVGDGNVDHGYIGRAELMSVFRPVAKVTSSSPGPDLVAAAAGALAGCHLAFKGVDSALAADCLRHAASLYDWAASDPATKAGKSYDEAVPGARAFYKSTGTYHHLLFAAATLFRATGDARYSKDAVTWGTSPDANALYGAYKSYSDWPSWDNAWYEGAALLLEAKQDPGGALGFKTQIVRMLNNWVNGKGDIKLSPKGQRFVSSWGSNRYAANAAAVALLAADSLGPLAQSAKCFGVSQLHYLWGDSGRSFVVGVGVNPPKRPHHRNAACTLSEGTACSSLFMDPMPNPNVLHGALVGGPSAPDDKFPDDRSDYITSEVAVDYNAMYTVATAAAMSLGDAFWSGYPGNCVGLVPGVQF